MTEQLGAKSVVATIEPWLAVMIGECLVKYGNRDMKITVDEKTGRVAGLWIDLGQNPDENR
jgi:hypothetical protein